MVKKKILVVEDEAPMRTMLAEDIEAAGYEVFQAADGKEGLDAALKNIPDLVIADVVMPNMHGGEFMKRLHATAGFKHIPFIILTARGLMRDYFEAMQVAAFIDKPFVTKNVLAKIAEVLGEVDVSKAQSCGETKKPSPVAEDPVTKTPPKTKSSGKHCNHCDHAVASSSSVCPNCGSSDVRWE